MTARIAGAFRISACTTSQPSRKTGSSTVGTGMSAGSLIAMKSGIVAVIGGEYPLADAAGAQADLESGRTSGSLLLIP